MFLLLCFEGLRCHLEDACISAPCHSGAICDTSPINGDPRCTCRTGWTGTDCSVDVDECSEGKNGCVCFCYSGVCDFKLASNSSAIKTIKTYTNIPT